MVSQSLAALERGLSGRVQPVRKIVSDLPNLPHELMLPPHSFRETHANTKTHKHTSCAARDIKPDNIMLDKWLTLKIGDFGFARAGDQACEWTVCVCWGRGGRGLQNGGDGRAGCGDLASVVEVTRSFCALLCFSLRLPLTLPRTLSLRLSLGKCS